MISTIVSSFVFLLVKNVDYEHEVDAYEVVKHVTNITKVINQYYPESKYVRIPGMIDHYPILSKDVSFGPKVLDTNFKSLQEFIEKNKNEGLDHIVVDDNPNRQLFLKDVFENDKEYPFLIKEFDSKDFDLKCKVKIYRIDYTKFDLIQKRQ